MHVLLADSVEERRDSVSRALEEAGVTQVSRPSPDELLADAVVRLAPDVIILDMQMPDRDAIDDLRHVGARQPRPIVLFTGHDDPEFMRDAIAAGVSSYNVVDGSLPDIRPIIGAAIAIFSRFHLLETTLQERALVDRAKALLIRSRGFTEPEAHRWLQRQAMRLGRRLPDVAAGLLEGEHG